MSLLKYKNFEKTNTNTNEEREPNPFERKTKTARSPNSTPAQTQSQSPEQKKQTPTSSDQSAFCRLGEHIANLVDMLEEGKRRSINQVMRDSIESIRALYELSAIEQRDDKAKKVIRRNNFSQTSPWFKDSQPKRRPKPNEETPNTKRRRGDSTKNKERPIVIDNSPIGVPVVPKTTKNPLEKGEKWIKVKKKKDTKTKNVPSVEKTRPDAIIIEAKEGISYAEILRKMKSDPKLGELGKTVSRIRRTQKGDLLFQLNETGEKTAQFKEAMLETLGKDAAIRTLTHRNSIEVRDIDEATTKDDICEAIKTGFQIGEISVSDVVSLRTAYGGTQTAIITLPADSAKTLLKSGRIKIGWVICRIRERKTLTKCFRCLEFGHLARNCKNESDRSKQCRRCSGDGHIAKDCTRDPLCMFCKNKNPDGAKHIAGSNNCPILRRALNDRK